MARIMRMTFGYQADVVIDEDDPEKAKEFLENVLPVGEFIRIWDYLVVNKQLGQHATEIFVVRDRGEAEEGAEADIKVDDIAGWRKAQK